MTAPVGLLAGAGRFPIAFAEKAKQCGIPVVCVGVAGMADPALAQVCTRFHWLRRMSLGAVLRAFRSGGVRQWTMAGKFHKHLLFQPWRWVRLVPDWRAVRFFFFRRRPDNRDDNLLLGLIDEFRAEGFECVSALDLCPELLVRPGVLTRRPPTAAEERDIRFGWGLAKEMGRLDVGQSVMIREGTALAVEAIEGTDEAIRRAGGLCRRSGFVVVKVAKPQQDMRFDVPTVGPATIETMRQAGATALGVEAARTILIDEADTIAAADRHGIAIVSLADIS
ncbi:MAG: UDP-2,3-diacylglucosamine diphosphatase LpxI [Gemmataceae bacterium]